MEFSFASQKQYIALYALKEDVLNEHRWRACLGARPHPNPPPAEVHGRKPSSIQISPLLCPTEVRKLLPSWARLKPCTSMASGRVRLMSVRTVSLRLAISIDTRTEVTVRSHANRDDAITVSREPGLLPTAGAKGRHDLVWTQASAGCETHEDVPDCTPGCRTFNDSGSRQAKAPAHFVCQPADLPAAGT
jgi:hypothetical protein